MENRKKNNHRIHNDNTKVCIYNMFGKTLNKNNQGVNKNNSIQYKHGIYLEYFNISKQKLKNLKHYVLSKNL